MDSSEDILLSFVSQFHAIFNLIPDYVWWGGWGQVDEGDWTPHWLYLYLIVWLIDLWILIFWYTYAQKRSFFDMIRLFVHGKFTVSTQQYNIHKPHLVIEHWLNSDISKLDVNYPLPGARDSFSGSSLGFWFISVLKQTNQRSYIQWNNPLVVKQFDRHWSCSSSLEIKVTSRNSIKTQLNSSVQSIDIRYLGRFHQTTMAFSIGDSWR